MKGNSDVRCAPRGSWHQGWRTPVALDKLVLQVRFEDFGRNPSPGILKPLPGAKIVAFATCKHACNVLLFIICL